MTGLAIPSMRSLRRHGMGRVGREAPTCARAPRACDECPATFLAPVKGPKRRRCPACLLRIKTARKLRQRARAKARLNNGTGPGPNGRPPTAPPMDPALARLECAGERELRATYATHRVRCARCDKVSIGLTCAHCHAPRP